MATGKHKSREGGANRIKHVVKSAEISALKEKINLKKIDRQLIVKEQEELRTSKLDERLALRIGNQCLTHMKDQELKMPITKNAVIFKNNAEVHRMKKMPLCESIKVNDQKLFTYGKRLLKEDHVSAKKVVALKETEIDLLYAREQAIYDQEQYEKQCQVFLHKQVKVKDNQDHELVAKLLHQRLQKILTELNKDIMTAPKVIERMDKARAAMKLELEDFQSLRDRARKYVLLEMRLLKPVNKELHNVNSHFISHIAASKAEIEDRRKSGALAKFLAAREANAISYTDVPNIMEAQFKRRGKMESVYTIMEKIKDATMVSDIRNVLDCFLDQKDVSIQLGKELEIQEERNKQLKNLLAASTKTNVFLRYNDTKSRAERKLYNTALAEEIEMTRTMEQPLRDLNKQDRLKSALKVAVHAIAMKLRQVKVDEVVSHTILFLIYFPEKKFMNQMRGDLPHDTKLVVNKTRKMVDMIRDNTVPIGPVKPVMLSHFKLSRVPPDCIPDGESGTPQGSFVSLQSFQLDHPNSVSRDFLKQTSKIIVAENSKKKRGKK